MKRIHTLMILCFIFSSVQIVNGRNSETYSKIENFSENLLLSISDSPYPQHVECTMAITPNNTIFVGWKESYSHDGSGVRVSFAKSIDRGNTWTEPFNMLNFISDTGQSDPWLVWDENSQTLFYAYLEYSFDLFEEGSEGISQITVAKSTNYGKSWTPVKASYGIGVADKETMTVSEDGTIYVVYDDLDYLKDLDPTVFYEATYVRLTRSIDGGNTYEEVNVIANSSIHPEDHLAPYVLTDSQNIVYIAWLAFTDGGWGDFYITSSDDMGETLEQWNDINPDTENGSFEVTADKHRATLPIIRFDANDRLYALWAGKYEVEGEWDCYIKYSDDYGQSWSPKYRVNPNIARDQWNPEMTIDSSGKIHVIYYDMDSDDSYRPYYRIISFPETSTENPTFSEPIAIASESTNSIFRRPGEYIDVCLDSFDTPHIVWSDGRNNEMDIYYAKGIRNEPISTPSSFLFFLLGSLLLLAIFRKRKN